MFDNRRRYTHCSVKITFLNCLETKSKNIYNQYLNSKFNLKDTLGKKKFSVVVDDTVHIVFILYTVWQNPVSFLVLWSTKQHCT